MLLPRPVQWLNLLPRVDMKCDLGRAGELIFKAKEPTRYLILMALKRTIEKIMFMSVRLK